MNVLEKFYTDALKLTRKLPDMQFGQDLCNFFIHTIRNYDKDLLPLAEDAVAYWLAVHVQSEREAAVQWFYAVFSLFDGSFTDDMDFSDEDWEELHTIVSASADVLDMTIVQSIMSTMLERHKL